MFGLIIPAATAIAFLSRPKWFLPVPDKGISWQRGLLREVHLPKMR